MTTPASESEISHALGRVKVQAAALLVGVPFYVLVVVLLLNGIAQALALGIYGLAAGAWVVLQTRRAVRGLAQADSQEAH